MYRIITKLAVLVAIVLASGGCGGGSSGGTPPPPAPPPEPFSYSVPEDIGDGWPVGDLAAEGFDTQMIVDMMDSVLDGSYPGIDSVAIARNGKLLLY